MMTPLVVPTGITSAAIAVGIYSYLAVRDLPVCLKRTLLSAAAWGAACFAAFCAMFWYVAYGSTITPPELFELLAAIACGMVFLVGLAFIGLTRRKS